MRIAVFGAGGTGGFLGGLLLRSGHDVSLIARGENLRAIQRDGLNIKSPKGNFSVRPALATDYPTQVGTVDTVIVSVKAWQVPEAAPAMIPLIGPETAVLALQNGVDAPGQLADVLGARHVMIGLLVLRSFLEKPGHIRHTFEAYPNLTLGEMDNQPSQRLEELRRVFEAAGLSVAVPADIHAGLWDNFVWACYSAGVATVSRCPIGVWRARPELRQMAEAAALEVVAIAKAKGIAVSEDILEQCGTRTDSLAADANPSMQDDIINGRPSELESWNGAAVRLGLETGVETPVNTFVYHCLLPQEMRARGLVEFS